MVTGKRLHLLLNALVFVVAVEFVGFRVRLIHDLLPLVGRDVQSTCVRVRLKV